jgi:hypothetical protein
MIFLVKSPASLLVIDVIRSYHVATPLMDIPFFAVFLRRMPDCAICDLKHCPIDSPGVGRNLRVLCNNLILVRPWPKRPYLICRIFLTAFLMDCLK